MGIADIITLCIGVLIILAILFLWLHVSSINSLLKKRAKEEREIEFARTKQMKKIVELLEILATPAE